MYNYSMFIMGNYACMLYEPDSITYLLLIFS